MKNLFFILLISTAAMFSQDAKEIVKKANDYALGKTSQGEYTMSLVRPDWQRDVTMKVWSKGLDYYMILITAPAREKGQVFMKRNKEMWNWVPSINKMIKIPPSMMSQSWMGSDFTNDDLLKESSIIKDYKHTLIGEEKIDEYDCYKIELIPLPEAAVVWGKIISWISKNEYYQLKAEYYDEFGDLINTQSASEVENVGNRVLPSKMVMIPMDKEGNQTILKVNNMTFDKEIPESFFTQQNMKKVR
ncbi:MAG: outer membrane lipoprotein-sorting protein [Ignavibacteriales bacterium]|nr:outer membrane lipoprotein-sorting protein [Ignavibacteriales bacterium]MCB9219582.1 outer membrane lipoprotein-sorting protein [Ignavibacteriales bacterium]MCB9257816.1 outer membrane lipoprotein-sorting protein [Ignavibacteriales bacterium]